jgi:SAM-dependent methyltransferase
MRLPLAALIAAVLLAGAGAAEQSTPPPAPQTHPKLFPPEQLVLLESPDRDEWQQPELVMDALQIADGARVADLGAGGGWFTIRLAHRVGPNGMVYAEDIQRQMLEAITRRVQAEGLTNVETVTGTADDPRLPGNLHAVLMVDTYTQLGNPVTLLRNVRRALAPNGLLGIVDFKAMSVCLRTVSNATPLPPASSFAATKRFCGISTFWCLAGSASACASGVFSPLPAAGHGRARRVRAGGSVHAGGGRHAVHAARHVEARARGARIALGRSVRVIGTRDARRDCHRINSCGIADAR